jgi:uncharacterized protein YndB with AHSA1/START domain
MVARPDDYRVERSVVVKAPPEKVYTLIEDVRRWPDWSMDEDKDPALKRQFFGPPRGRDDEHRDDDGEQHAAEDEDKPNEHRGVLGCVDRP